MLQESGHPPKLPIQSQTLLWQFPKELTRQGNRPSQPQLVAHLPMPQEI
jgi:hypothetical protein